MPFGAATALVPILILAALATTARGGPSAEDHSTPVLCYVGTWAQYRTGDGRFDASSFDPRLCSHVIYSFVGLDADTHRIKSLDSTSELSADEGGKDGFKSYVDLKVKFPRLKVLVAIGGWTEGSEKYSAMASDPERRRQFVQSAVDFVRKYGFDGLDVDWEYPTQRGGKPHDKDNFSVLLEELRTAFNRHGWILSVAIAAGRYVIDQAYDIPTVAKNVDFINVMTYDYHGKWENKTGHNAPLHQRKDGYDASSNINHSIHHLIRLGAPREKLVLGLPFYGRTYTLDRPLDNAVGAAAHEPGPQGPFTKEANFMGYNELCTEISSPSWTKKRDDEQKVPYAFKGASWISYDDDVSLTAKVKYALEEGLRGVMVWSIETDDANGRCHGVRMFLLKTVHRVLAEEHSERTPASEKDEDRGATTRPPDQDNVIPDDDEPSDHRRRGPKGSDANSVHGSLEVATILTIWVLHAIKQRMDVGG